ncbi:MAG: hypothetical protein GY820_00815, partial [Gammaproteobacteria bacterium]|nr:hypothetical protein [Gammaproteobacteria bacterium]
MGEARDRDNARGKGEDRGGREGAQRPPKTMKFTGNCYNCGKPNHRASECRQPQKPRPAEAANQVDQSQCLFKGEENDVLERNEQCLNLTSDQLDLKWVIDSGATSHMTNKSSLLKSFKAFDAPQVVRVGDGRKLLSTGRGEIDLLVEHPKADGTTITITLQNVLLVPDIACSLFSTAAAADKGKTVVFKRNSCSFLTEKGIVLARGHREGNLYFLHSKPKSQANEQLAAVISNRPTFELLHQRLGHVHKQRLTEMIKKKLVVGELAKELGKCRGCAEGKFARAPFKSTEKSVKTKDTLALVHTDLCGTMQTPTPGGKRYVLTFLDDWLRMVKIYFLTIKDQVCEHFKIFKAATAATGKTLKALRSD